MKRHHKTASAGLPKTLQPGHCIFWKRQIYRITALDPQTALLVHVEILPTGEQTQLALTELFASPQTEADAPLFASSLDDLYTLMQETHTLSLPQACPDGLPETYVFKAQMIVQVVEMVRQLVQEDERRAQARQEAWSRTKSVQRALATCNGTTLRIQLQDITEEYILHVGLSTYYKYDRLYRIYAGDTTRIAASFRRATFHLSRMSQAQLHFTDMCLVLYYGNTRSTKQRVYQLAQEILDHCTQGYWIDPERCGKAVPENVVTELLDPKIPMKALLSNPEKKAVLTQIDMPSRAWFYGYARYMESRADAGQQLMTDRLGKDIWEQYHLVFDTFVRRAQLPLQYVFADHCLLNAWIVDDQTRSQPSRLWLTVLIDAYSRSILGIALLPEEPCIESIQSALRHSIWHKTSHTRLGVDGKWDCYGIPQQLFLDNAWAHHCHSLENLARVLSCKGVYNPIDLVFRPPYKGRYGAIIERLFRNFSGQIKELAVGAIASKSRKDTRGAAKEACLLYSDMDRLLHQLILRYQHTPHRELGGMTPHQKWSEGVTGSGLPLIPALTPEMDRLFLRMYPNTRTVRSRGIPAFGLNYWSAELGGIERRERDGQAIRYHFRYDPADICRIALFRDGTWVGDGYAKELQLADGTYRHISLAEWQMAKRQVRQGEDGTEGKTAAELVLVRTTAELGKQRTKEKKTAQRRASKHELSAKDSPKQDPADESRAPLDDETEQVLRFLHG